VFQKPCSRPIAAEVCLLDLLTKNFLSALKSVTIAVGNYSSVDARIRKDQVLGERLSRGVSQSSGDQLPHGSQSKG